MEWVCRAHRRFRPDLSSETCALNVPDIGKPLAKTSHRLYPRRASLGQA
jgi:hypothetical protein